MKKILITGGSGFIGRNLKEQLLSEFKVISPSSKELNLLDDIAVKKYLQRHAFDEIIHCATHNATKTSDKDLSKVFYSNLRMFFNLARNNTMYGRMFYFGSGAEYDKEHYLPKMKEDYFDTHVPTDDYGFSKYIAAKYIEAVSNIFDLRIFGCFGKYEDWRIRFISNAICKAMYGYDITIQKNVYFDYLYVDDLAKILKVIINKRTLKNKYYNVCTGNTIDLYSLAKIVVKISGRKVAIKVAEEGFKPEYSGDNNLLLNEFKLLNFTSHEKAIAKLYTWYESNKASIDQKQLLINS